MQLIELQNKIHKQNKDLGWWDEPRPFGTFVCLFHSELSAAMEGDRKGLNDDHLPQYPMFQVELADFVIRCMDWLGSVGNENYDFGTFGLSKSRTKFIADRHRQISDAYSLSEDPYYGPMEEHKTNIASSVVQCFGFADYEGFDLHQIILEKVEYNLTLLMAE